MVLPLQLLAVSMLGMLFVGLLIRAAVALTYEAMRWIA